MWKDWALSIGTGMPTPGSENKLGQHLLRASVICLLKSPPPLLTPWLIPSGPIRLPRIQAQARRQAEAFLVSSNRKIRTKSCPKGCTSPREEPLQEENLRDLVLPLPQVKSVTVSSS